MKIKVQNNYRDCGISVIQALCAYWHGVWINEDTLKMQAVYSKEGINGQNLINLGKIFGIKLTAFRVKIDDLQKSKIKDYIVALVNNQNQGHYIVFKMKENFVITYDPICGKRKITYEKFARKFHGVIFLVEKSAFNFRRKNLNNPWKIVFLKMNLLIMSIFLTLIIFPLIFLSSFFLKLMVDLIIPWQLKKDLLIITFNFIIIVLLRLIFESIKNYIIVKINLYCQMMLTNIYYQSLLDTSISNYEKLAPSEHLHRLNLITSVSEFITNFHRALLEDILMLIVTTIFCFIISPQMFALVIFFAFLITIVTAFSQWNFKKLYQDKISKEIKVFNYQSDFVASFLELKTEHYQTFFKNKLDKITYKNYKLDYKIWKMTILQGNIIDFLVLIMPIIITFVGANFIFKNNLTIGSLIFFLTIVNHFLNALKSLVTFLFKCNVNFKNLKLMKFCLNFPPEINKITLNNWSNATENINYSLSHTNIFDFKKQTNLQNEMQKFKIEQIKLKNLTFSFDKPFFYVSEFIIKENIHLLGKNGSGKTTLLKIIGSYYQGDQLLLVNGIFLKESLLNVYRNKIFFASPLTHLPNLTIWEYITLNNNQAINDFLENCKTFSLFDLFNDIDLNLNQSIINNGQNLSAGQKQIVIMLRLLAFRYDLILNDEGLENIDNQKILIIKNAINFFQKQAIFIEISHSKKYLSFGKEVVISEIMKRL